MAPFGAVSVFYGVRMSPRALSSSPSPVGRVTIPEHVPNIVLLCATSKIGGCVIGRFVVKMSHQIALSIDKGESNSPVNVHLGPHRVSVERDPFMKVPWAIYVCLENSPRGRAPAPRMW